jgi:hypothetical protein
LNLCKKKYIGGYNNMNGDILHLKDNFHSRDGVLKTMIMAGYDLKTNKNGVHYLGEEIIERQHNKVVVGGSIEMLKKIFGAESSLTVSSLNELMSIDNTGVPVNGETKTVCLFNVGIGGCGSSYADVQVTLDQANTVPSMIPFRIVSTPAAVDQDKYWFKKSLNDSGMYAYYLKRFENNPTVHCLFKDGIGDEDGTEVTGNPASYNRTEGVETFVELVLEISSDDLREYFALYDNPDFPRFNTIGLCSGTLSTLANGEFEYRDVHQFSVLNFSNEILHFEKNLSIIYRVYLS